MRMKRTDCFPPALHSQTIGLLVDPRVYKSRTGGRVFCYQFVCFLEQTSCFWSKCWDLSTLRVMTFLFDKSYRLHVVFAIISDINPLFFLFSLPYKLHLTKYMYLFLLWKCIQLLFHENLIEIHPLVHEILTDTHMISVIAAGDFSWTVSSFY